MITLAEHLPTELWFEIFSYFEAHALLHTFTNLNRYFDQLITSEHILFNVRLGKYNRNPLEYSSRPYWTEQILNRIISIRPALEQQTSHIPEFLRWHCTELFQLKSLTVKLRGREIPHVCNALQQLHCLHHLSIQCVPNQILLDGILALPTVRICRLEFSSPISPIHLYSDNISGIETFDMKLKDDSHGSITHLLLSHMPRLKRLELDNQDIYVKNREWIFCTSLFVLPELHTLKFRCSSNYSVPIIFQNLHRNLPALRQLDLRINFDFIHEGLLNNLIHHWWPIFEEIERTNIFIRCQKYFIMLSDNIETNFDEFQSVLRAMNEQHPNCVKTAWTENASKISKVFDISICKSF